MIRGKNLSGEIAVARAIKECGIDHFFYVTGGMLISPSIEKEGIKMVLCRNEKAACNMADGYSRVTGKPSVCYAQHGAAAAILASMLYEPMYAHSPVVAFTGSVPTLLRDLWQYQDCPEMPYFEATCKFNADVTDLSRIGEYLRAAIQIAVSGCPGPTHVNMHLDMASDVAKMQEVRGDKTFFKVPPFRPRAEPGKVHDAANLLISAERPVIICGSGVHLSGAYNEVKELAELISAPVATNYKGKGSFPEEHPLSIGVMGVYGREVTNQIIREADLVFFISVRPDSHTTEEFTAPEPDSCKIIQLDIDPVVIGRKYRADVALIGDCKVVLNDLLETLKTMIRKPVLKSTRLQEIAKEYLRYENLISPMMASEDIPIKPQRMIKEVEKSLKSEDIVVSDTGQMLCWTTRLMKVKKAGMTYIPCGGTLGSSFALAIGVSFGAKEGQRVLNLIGDGGILYNISELETAKRCKDMHVPFVALVNNNSSLGQTRPPFENWALKGDFKINHADFTELNYAKIAEAFGCYGVRVERPSEIAEAINGAFDSGKPAIVDVVTDKREYAPIGLVRRTKKEVFPGVPSY
ncbi:MAG: thiamine pyrophosphate-binding protein [Nitrososphaeria archaeon]|jgi:acetolactate synthase-1/2/3 large subunit